MVLSLTLSADFDSSLSLNSVRPDLTDDLDFHSGNINLGAELEPLITSNMLGLALNEVTKRFQFKGLVSWYNWELLLPCKGFSWVEREGFGVVEGSADL